MTRSTSSRESGSTLRAIAASPAKSVSAPSRLPVSKSWTRLAKSLPAESRSLISLPRRVEQPTRAIEGRLGSGDRSFAGIRPLFIARNHGRVGAQPAAARQEKRERSRDDVGEAHEEDGERRLDQDEDQGDGHEDDDEIGTARAEIDVLEGAVADPADHQQGYREQQHRRKSRSASLLQWTLEIEDGPAKGGRRRRRRQADEVAVVRDGMLDAETRQLLRRANNVEVRYGPSHPAKRLDAPAVHHVGRRV